MLKEKLILTDVDGVLLHWEWMFDIWMQRHGYVKLNHVAYNTNEAYGLTSEEGDRLCTMFNETVYVRSLPPYRDAMLYTKKLHEEHGYVFHAITSISSDPMVVDSRVENLHRVFGRSMFFDITCLDPAVSKLSTLTQYENSGCYWIEDHLENCALGADLGLHSILMNQTYNQLPAKHNPRYKYLHRLNNWKQIYDVIVG